MVGNRVTVLDVDHDGGFLARRRVQQPGDELLGLPLGRERTAEDDRAPAGAIPPAARREISSQDDWRASAASGSQKETGRQWGRTSFFFEA